MKKKKVWKRMALLMAASMTLAACGQAQPSEEASSAEGAAVQETQTTSEEEQASVDTDASDVKVEVFLTTNWGGELPPEGDPVEAYIEEFAGGDWSLTLPVEGETELVTRFASGVAPDVIGFSDATQVDMLYDQGVLVDDWNVYADKIPTVMENMGETQRAILTTEDGKLKALGTLPGQQKFTFMIRQDWLDNLGMDMPTTHEELLEVMKAFTFDDPDGNGVDDTYGFTAAGGGGVGEVRNLLLLFGNQSYYITEDNTVSHPVVDGSFKEYLDFAKAMVDAKVINPDWYTLGWDERKPALYAGSYGICWYPPAALLSETARNIEDSSDTTMADAWAVMDPCGGKALSKAVQGSLLSVSAETAQDSAKMDIICDFLEKTSGFSENYLGVRMYVGMSEYTGATVYSPTNVYQYYDSSREDDFFTLKNAYGGIANWGKLIDCNGGSVIMGNTKEPDYWSERAIQLNEDVDALETWPNEFRLYTPDPTLANNMDSLLQQFEISYIMGENSDYDGFVNEWLSSGGQDLLDGAEETFKRLGLME
ncbi:MAG TPA: extracellular solute-binding protein [Candidatus Eisenbergiella merdipullorum]|uniref:Extracellular solute-binding protein n=1 Tax=Candidatus Eisenbergiella merdipullorum TaxID=2838553 RepID=A0A9D2L166_9FIRM|nr:extracellular solute-binding protein [Candidatus Eisenbergiella merdipullorum]